MPAVVKWYGPQVKAVIDRDVSHRLRLAALVVEGTIKRSMYNEPKTGKLYKKPNTNAWYQASAPYESPAVRTARLAGSISHRKPFKTTDRSWHCFVGTFGKQKTDSSEGIGQVTTWRGTEISEKVAPVYVSGASNEDVSGSGLSGVEGAKYPLYLELGTKHMAPRPYLRRGLDNSRKKIKALFRGTRILSTWKPISMGD